MKTASILAGLALCAALAASVAHADPSLISVEVCSGRGSCQRVFVDKAKANLVKTTPDGSIVINSIPVDNEAEAAAAMRECNKLKRDEEASALDGEVFRCRLEPSDDAM